MTPAAEARGIDLDRVLVCTLATHPASGLTTLQKSCRKFNINLTIVGWGQEFRGYGWRLKLLYSKFTEVKGQYDYVLFIDGFDTIFATGLAHIMAKYWALDTPFLLSAECNCWPWEYPGAPDYPAAPTRYRFVNGGGYIAELDYLVGLMQNLKTCELADGIDDQGFWARAYVSGQARIKLDHYCQIFQCLLDSQQDLVFKREILNRVTGSTPCIIHGNGHVDMKRPKALILGPEIRSPLSWLYWVSGVLHRR